MVFVTSGQLGISFAESVLQVPADDYAVYSSAQPYEYLNLSDGVTTFVRVVVA